MTAPNAKLRLFSLSIGFEQDVVTARQQARQLAGSLGFPQQLQIRIATAVSEIARNAYQYAGGGRVDFSVVSEPSPSRAGRLRQTLFIEVSDRGNGIAQLEEILGGSYRSKTGMGLGIVGTKRLMDRLDIESTRDGTTIRMSKVFPPTAPELLPKDLQAIVDELSSRSPKGAFEEVRVQNRELLEMMSEAHLREEELSRMNQELSETNTGVLALYDELETLNRISLMLASKLDLVPLAQSLIEVTTGLTDADLGVFLLGEGAGQWRLYAVSGRSAGALSDLGLGADGKLIWGEIPASISRYADISDIPSGGILGELHDGLGMLSCMSVPVQQPEGGLMGMFHFWSKSKSAFSERSERILGSVAAQAAIGLEKARLFSSVTAASDAKDQFLAILSHELRTPLTPVLALISSLHDNDSLPPGLREKLVVIDRNVRLQARLIDDLLDFNRVIQGKLHLDNDIVDVHALVTNVVEICQVDADSKGQQLTLHMDAGRSHVNGDSARLQQTLWNILKNAIKFTPVGGNINIATSVEGETLRIVITDDGVGIEPDVIREIFNAFEQGGKQVAVEFGGLGLGLAIARKFAELHGGTISAHSAGKMQGTTVTVELPLAQSKSLSAPTAPTTEMRADLTGTRILIVDDHADTLEVFTMILESMGLVVSTALDGKHALEMARRKSFDLLVSDLGLPDMSGYELVERIHQIQKLPAIAQSGYGMPSDIEKSRNAGFNAHLIKPVAIPTLIETIRNVLATSPPKGGAD
ncbi:ATP-binding protein [Haloferula sp. BvORR071]|uniref:ATP-binding protein n=1 Tax=Haloferula sp. BvORR071 TaxID=1396141 RepID=UPI000697A766|nr:ATP-binding protein [Haloferula sp. BvORR071]